MVIRAMVTSHQHKGCNQSSAANASCPSWQLSLLYANTCILKISNAIPPPLSVCRNDDMHSFCPAWAEQSLHQPLPINFETGQAALPDGHGWSDDGLHSDASANFLGLMFIASHSWPDKRGFG